MSDSGNTSSLLAPVLRRPRDFQWYWNSSTDGVDKQWQKYSDVENEIIEDAFNEKKLNVEIDGDYIVNFEQQVRCKKDDPHKQYQIKREKLDGHRTTDHRREERFLLPVALVDYTVTAPSQSQQPDDGLAQLRLYVYFMVTYFNLEVLNQNKTIADVVEEAAQGMIDEGNARGKAHEAEWLAKTLRYVKDSGFNIGAESYEIPLDIGQTCVYLYTKESFWFKLIYHTLGDPETITRHQVKTLGPFCYLLDRFMRRLRTNAVDTVYRGMQLDDEQRKLLMKRSVKFTSFTSTSSNREVAESFHGNTMLVIDFGAGSNVKGRSDRYGRDISLLSDFPEEKEFLIWPSTRFYFDKYRYDAEKNKHTIYLSYELPRQQSNTSNPAVASSGRWPFDWEL